MIITSSIGNLNIVEKQVNTFMFSDTKVRDEVYFEILKHLKVKVDRDLWGNIINVYENDFEELNAKVYDVIVLDRYIDLDIDKEFKKFFEKDILKIFGNNEVIDGCYNKFEQLSNEFVNELSNHYNLNITLDSTVTPKELLKSFDYKISKNNLEVNSLEAKLIFLEIMLKAVSDKEVVLVINNPSADIGLNDYNQISNKLKELKLTTLVFTNSLPVLVNTDINYVNIIKDITKIEVVDIVNELTMFIDSEHLAQEVIVQIYHDLLGIPNVSDEVVNYIKTMV